MLHFPNRPIKPILITAAEFAEFCELGRSRRWDWPAIFNSNPSGDIWTFIKYGRSTNKERDYVIDSPALLQRVLGIYAVRREECGRFFINERGAFFRHGKSKPDEQFIQWKTNGEELRAPDLKTMPVPSKTEPPIELKPVNFEQVLKEIREARKQRNS